MRHYLSLLLLSTLFFGLNGQDYSSFDCDVIVDGQVLAFPFTGGFDAPQFSHCDFNRDGIKDLFVFDRQGGVPMVFEYSGSGLSRGYSFTREYKSSLPDTLLSWAKMADYNGDGLYDIFSAPLLPGANLYQAQLDQNGNLSYQLRRMGRSPGSLPIIYYEATTGIFNMGIPSSDIPEIIDVDNDGDLDILSFDILGSFVSYYENRQMDKNLPRDTMDFAILPGPNPQNNIGDRCFGKIKEATLNATISLSPDPNECSTGFHGSTKVDKQKSGVHAGSTVMAFDNDGDGDLELLIGDLNTSTLVFTENGGTINNAWMTSTSDSFPMYDRTSITPQFSAAYHVDVDNDGLRDIITSVNSQNNTLNFNNVHIYLNTGNDTEPFRFIQDDFLTEETVDLGSFTAPIFLDENGDGLIDILVGSGGFFSNTGTPTMFLALFRNVGSMISPRYELIDADYLNFSSFKDVNTRNPAPAVGDLDSDGDQDLIIGVEGVLFYFENIAGLGQPMEFANADFGSGLDDGYMSIVGGMNAKPSMADVNGDGLMDIVIGELKLNSNETNSGPIFGNLAYYQNQGSVGAPSFDFDLSQAPNNPALGGINSKLFLDNFSSISGAPHFFNIEDELHMLLGSEDGRIKRYQIDRSNLEGPYTPTDSIVGGIIEGIRSTPSLADIDTDGYMEMVVGNGRGGLSMFNTDIVSGLSSTNNTSDILGIKLYPNPTKNILNLEIDKSIMPFSIDLYSIEGTLIRSYSQDLRQISIGELNSGIYLLSILTEEGEITERIIKI